MLAAYVLLIVASGMLLPTVPPGGVRISIEGGVPGADGYLDVDVVMYSDGATVGGMQGDIIFDSTVLELTPRDCQINPAIGLFPYGPSPAVSCFDDPSIGPCKNLSSALETCPGGDGCPVSHNDLSVFRAIIAATTAPNNNVIPDSVLFSCRFRVLDFDRLPQQLRLGNVLVSDPFGTRLAVAIGSGTLCTAICGSGCYGAVDCLPGYCLPAAGGRYPGTCSSLAPPTRTATQAIPTPTGTLPTPEATAARIADDGCEMKPRGSRAGLAWVLLLGALAMAGGILDRSLH